MIHTHYITTLIIYNPLHITPPPALLAWCIHLIGQASDVPEKAKSVSGVAPPGVPEGAED